MPTATTRAAIVAELGLEQVDAGHAKPHQIAVARPIDAVHADLGTFSPNAALIDTQNRLVMVGVTGSLPSIARVNADGSADATLPTIRSRTRDTVQGA